MEGLKTAPWIEKSTPTQVEEARETLRGLLPPGSLCRTILRHTSRSGMTRAISPVANGEDITRLVVRAVPGWKSDPVHGGIKMGGCGMDMGFSLVYSLSRTLYPTGHDCIGRGTGTNTLADDYRPTCPSNDHSNGDRDYTPGEDHHHADGGYAIRHAWL